MLLVVWTATEEVPKPVYCIVKMWWCYEFGKHMEVMGSRGVDIKVYVWLRMVKGCEVEIYGDYLLNIILKVTKK